MTFYSLLKNSRFPLNFFRLVLAIFVLYSHTFPLGGFGGDPLIPTPSVTTSYGGFAVGAFFSLSGLFIMSSALRSSVQSFLLSRFFRVFPALLIVLLISSFVLGPLITISTNGDLSNYFNFSANGPIAYVLHNVSLPQNLQYGIDNIFRNDTPFGILSSGSVVNGSLWTLPIEIRFYLVALLIGIFAKKVNPFVISSSLLVIVGMLIVLQQLKPTLILFFVPDFIPTQNLDLLFCFMFGATVGSVAEKFTLTNKLGILSIVVFCVSSFFGPIVFSTIGLGITSIVIPFIASLLTRLPLNIFDSDLSYGTYIWAFPVQQTLAFTGIATSVTSFFLISLGCTIPLAFLSWKLIEKPAMTFKEKINTS